jgi:MYXO-CTERM domain-containing protein
MRMFSVHRSGSVVAALLWLGSVPAFAQECQSEGGVCTPEGVACATPAVPAGICTTTFPGGVPSCGCAAKPAPAPAPKPKGGEIETFGAFAAMAGATWWIRRRRARR